MPRCQCRPVGNRPSGVSVDLVELRRSHPDGDSDDNEAGCRSSASPDISAGRTLRCAGSLPTTVGGDQPHVSAASFGSHWSNVRRSQRARRRWSIRAIAQTLGRSPSTVCREVNATGARRSIWRSWPSERPPGERSGQDGPSWPSGGGFAESSNGSSRPNGRPSRSQRGWLRSTPIARSCRCPTRPSTSHSSSKAVERCAKSSIAKAHAAITVIRLAVELTVLLLRSWRPAH